MKQPTDPEALSLISGGLDSTVATAIAHKDIGVGLTITIDYHQPARDMEKQASRVVSASLNIPHKLIETDIYRETSSPILNNTIQDSDDYWVPNRNGLFINMGAVLAETLDYKYIVVGFNIDEAEEFPDNSKEFLTAVNKSLKYSTRSEVEIISPTVEMTKEEMVKTGLDLKVPFEAIYSCYKGVKPMCGRCPSCKRLIKAYKDCGILQRYKELFDVGDFIQ